MIKYNHKGTNLSLKLTFFSQKMFKKYPQEEIAFHMVFYEKTKRLFQKPFLNIGVRLSTLVTYKRINKKQDIQKLLGLRLVADLPKIKTTKQNGIEFSNFFSQMKVIFLQISMHPERKCIMITSAKRHEGKSLIAACLAYYLNSVGQKILLIDACSANPSIEKLSQLFDCPTFEYPTIAGQPSDSTNKTHELKTYNGLNIISHTFFSNYPEYKISKDQIDRLKKEFDFIIFDTDSWDRLKQNKDLNDCADQLMIVVEQNNATQRELDRMIKDIKTLNFISPYVILNKMKNSSGTK